MPTGRCSAERRAWERRRRSHQRRGRHLCHQHRGHHNPHDGICGGLGHSAPQTLLFRLYASFEFDVPEPRILLKDLILWNNFGKLIWHGCCTIKSSKSVSFEAAQKIDSRLDRGPGRTVHTDSHNNHLPGSWALPLELPEFA